MPARWGCPSSAHCARYYGVVLWGENARHAKHFVESVRTVDVCVCAEWYSTQLMRRFSAGACAKRMLVRAVRARSGTSLVALGPTVSKQYYAPQKEVDYTLHLYIRA